MSVELFQHGDVRDAEIAKGVLAILLREYAGHMWFVSASASQGIVTIQLMYLDVLGKNARRGVLLHLSAIEDERRVKAAGGELLERFRLARGRAMDETRALALVNGLDLAV